MGTHICTINIFITSPPDLLTAVVATMAESILYQHLIYSIPLTLYMRWQGVTIPLLYIQHVFTKDVGIVAAMSQRLLYPCRIYDKSSPKFRCRSCDVKEITILCHTYNILPPQYIQQRRESLGRRTLTRKHHVQKFYYLQIIEHVDQSSALHWQSLSYIQGGIAAVGLYVCQLSKALIVDCTKLETVLYTLFVLSCPTELNGL